MLVATSGAQAAPTIRVRLADPDYVRVGEPARIEVTAEDDVPGADETPGVLTVQVIRGTSCGKSPDANTPILDAPSYVAPLRIGRPTDPIKVSWTPTAPPLYLVCGFFRNDVTHEVTTDFVPAYVREPTTALAIDLTGDRFWSGEKVPFTIAASSSSSSKATVQVGPASLPCNAAPGSGPPQTDWVSEQVVEGPLKMTKIEATAPQPGQYHLCGYVGTGKTDPHPTTVVTGPTFTSAALPSCHFGPPPSKRQKTVALVCKGAPDTLNVVVTATRGSKSTQKPVTLVKGRAALTRRSLGLERGKRVEVSASVNGLALTHRTLRGR